MGCGSFAFWGTLFQLAVSPFNWIDKVMEEVGKKFGRMLDKEASSRIGEDVVRNLPMKE